MVVRLAVIGCGSWGMNHVRSARRLKDAELAAACDASPTAAERVKEAAPLARFSTDPHEVFEDPSIEGVIIATPAPTHAAVARAALAANKHILVEKPFVLDPEDGLPIVREAASRNRVLMVGHLLRYHPYFRRLRELVRAGDLGKIHYVYSERVNLGVVRSDENAFWSLAAHDLSMMNALMDDEPVEIAATGQAFLRAGVEDVVFATVRYQKQTIGHIHVSWLDPQKRRQLTVVGTKRMAVFDDMEPAEKLRIYDKSVASEGSVSFEQFLSVRDGDVHIPYLRMTEPLQAEQQHFVDCIKNKTTPETDGDDAMRVLRCLVGANASLKAGGKPIAIHDP
jgi:predicted dehydrogenase